MSTPIVLWDIDGTLVRTPGIGVRCALVATGTYGVDDIRTLDADLVLTDLSSPGTLSSAIIRGR